MVPSLKLLIVSDAHLLEIFDVDTGVRKWHFTTDYRGMTMKAHAFAFEECSPTSFFLQRRYYSVSKSEKCQPGWA